MPGIGVILNPYSKRYKKNPEQMKRMGFIVGDKASCKETEDLRDLRRVAEEFKTRDIDILAISGGDGTNHCTLTTFIQVYGDKPLPKIAFLRGGTVNTVAGTLGIKGSSETILSNMLVKYHEDIPFETKEVIPMKINDEYGFIWGIGVIYRFMEAYYHDGTPSPTHAAITLIRAVFSGLCHTKFTLRMFDRFEADISINGKNWPFKNYAALYAGSLGSLGLNFRVFYHVFKNPHKFHAAAFNMNPRTIIPHLISMYRGVPSGCPHVLEEPSDDMIIKCQKPMPYTIDGDMKAPVDTFRIQAGPKLTVIIS